MDTADRIYIWFADNGNIRKWSHEPFEEGTEYRRSTVTPAEIAGVVDQALDLRDKIMRGKRCVTDTGPAVKPVIELASVHILDDLAALIERLAASQAETSDPYTRQSAADLVSEIDRDLPPDFPNYADWPITIPAGHWRAIRALIDQPSTEGGTDGE